MPRKNFFAASLAAACALSASATQTSSHPYVNPAKGEFPIMGWYSIPDSALTPERFAEMREAGFNLSLSHLKNNSEVERSLKAAEGSGVRLFVMTGDLEKNPRATVERFRDHPQLAGWYLLDEPSANAFPRLASLRDSVYRYDTRHLPYINLLPDFVEPKQLGAKDYDDYVRRFIEEIRLPMVSYDLYPIIRTPEGKIYVQDNLYSNLECVSRLSKEHGMPFWAFCLASSHGHYPEPVDSHMRLEAFAALGYGAQGLQYFTYWDPYFHTNTPIDDAGRRTAVYYRVQNLNKEIHALSKIFLGSEVYGVWHTGDSIPRGTSRRSAPLPAPFTGDISADGIGLMVSHFKGGDGHTYLMLVNRDIEKAQRVTAPFSGRLKAIQPDGSRRKALPVEYIRPGGYLLYRLK